jgi:polyhydroxybutyrate depolymerase
MKKTFLLLGLAFMAFFVNAQDLKTLTWGGQQRQYLEYVPTTYSAETPAPVLFMLHGLGDDATNFFNATNVRATAEQRGWIVVCPQALDFNLQTPLGGYDFGTSWNAGITVTVQLELYGMPFNFDVTVNPDADDSGFLMATLETLGEEYTIEPDSVFFAGFSLGACMSHRMAIEHGERINAIAAVSGVVGNDMQNLIPAAHVDVLEIFGTSDEMISYDNAEISLQSYGTHSIGLPAEATVEYWRNFNQCSETAIFEEYPDLVNDGLTFEMYSYLDGTNDSRVGFIKVNNGLHCWYLGGNNDIDYTEEIAKFFTGTIDVTDIAEQNESSLSLYPNPATNFIFVETQNAVNIYDLCGKLVLQGSGRIDVSSLPEGMYFVKSENGFTKLVINR